VSRWFGACAVLPPLSARLNPARSLPLPCLTSLTHSTHSSLNFSSNPYQPPAPPLHYTTLHHHHHHHHHRSPALRCIARSCCCSASALLCNVLRNSLATFPPSPPTAKHLTSPSSSARQSRSIVIDGEPSSLLVAAVHGNLFHRQPSLSHNQTRSLAFICHWTHCLILAPPRPFWPLTATI